MNIHIKIDKVYSFPKKNSVKIEFDMPDTFRAFPRTQGVYIFHKGQVDKIWTSKDRILYIGAANREKLRSRVKKNSEAKLAQLCHTGKINSDVYVSYHSFDGKVPDYLPFLVEGYLLCRYEKKFNCLPNLNIGRR